MKSTIEKVSNIEPPVIEKGESIAELKDAKRLFLKKGTCSQAFFHILNREFGQLREQEERAADSLAGGIIQEGYQCGMLWGSTLAAGARSFRQNADQDVAIGQAITTTQHVMESFVQRTGSPDCLEITSCDWSSKLSMARYFATGKFISCYTLSERWAPEAVQATEEGLAERSIDLPPHPVSCASVVARKMGASDEQAVMVAGFAGGMGLSGNACGALAAAVWMKSLAYDRKNSGKSPMFNPEAKETLKKFYKTTDYEILCSKICRRKFLNVAEHTEYIKNGGCKKLINFLADS